MGDGTTAVSVADYINSQFDPSLSWRDIDWIRGVWDGPIVIKGIQTVADARIAADVGVEAIALSNHGGRQLDSSPAIIDLVEPVAEAVGDRIEIICDGGVRRGGDIVKAVARGARACMAGRVHLYGLAAGGQPGVEHALGNHRPRRPAHDGTHRRTERRRHHPRPRLVGVRATVRLAVFDLGGVVCRFDPDARRRALASVTGRSGDEIDAAIWDSGLDRRAERGEIDPAALPALIGAALAVDIATDALRAAWSLAFEPSDEVLALVDRLHVPAVLFTNNGPIVDRCLDHELSRVRARFAHVLLSWRLGAVKPEPAAYEAVIARLGVGADELLFVDDSSENVAAARALGWAAEVFVDAATLERHLVERRLVGSA